MAISIPDRATTSPPPGTLGYLARQADRLIEEVNAAERLANRIAGGGPPNDPQEDSVYSAESVTQQMEALSVRLSRACTTLAQAIERISNVVVND